jgi:peroxiredoxin
MKYFTKDSFICLPLIICVTNINAQVSVLQKASDKIESSKNFSFNEKGIIKSSFNPNTITFDKEVIFVKKPQDKNFGYFFKINSGKDCFMYNGQNAVTDLNYQDSTYTFIEPGTYAISLPGYLKQLKEKLRESNSFIQEKDTVINAVQCYHFVQPDMDSGSNDNRSYFYTHWFIDKKSGTIACIINMWRTTDANGNMLSNYMESFYSGFKFDQGNIPILSLEIPESFHLKNKEKRALKIGTAAPGWALYSTDGNKLSLSELKGKVVLIDFSYVGCLPCMQAIKSMNHLHEEYKDKDVEIVSIYPIDKTMAVGEYVKKYGIKYPVYIDANTLPAKYQITGYPCFYFIDKDGKIANLTLGYSDDFETETSSILDGLLNK